MDCGIYNSFPDKATMGTRLKSTREEQRIKRPAFCMLVTEDRKRLENRDDIDALEPDTLKQWELGNNRISIDWIPSICNVLGCDLDYLFGFTSLKTKAATDINGITGLSQNAIDSLIEIFHGEPVLKKVIHNFLDDFLDDFCSTAVAISYERYKTGYFEGSSLCIMDKSGKISEIIDDNIALVSLQNAFSQFAQSSKETRVSRYELRNHRAQLTNEEIEKLADEIRRGK